jgi:glutaconate CoA-transferase, subunit A
LIKARLKGLQLVTVPTGGLAADILIGAGIITKLETAAVSLGEFGPAPRFIDALKRRDLKVADATCPAIHAGLQAAEKGIPFIPLRGLIGSDLVAARSDWQTINNPYAMGPQSDPIVLVPAIKPDVALFHAAEVDRHGNVFVGVRRELMLMAHASATSIVTVEAQVDDDFLKHPLKAAGTIPALYLGAVVLAPGGSAPVGFAQHYEPDRALLARYAREAKTDRGFAAWCEDILGVAPEIIAV